ncbi:hypothetical protein CQA67_33355, partial [Klebsiella pneumoniae]
MTANTASRVPSNCRDALRHSLLQRAFTFHHQPGVHRLMTANTASRVPSNCRDALRHSLLQRAFTF